MFSLPLRWKQTWRSGSEKTRTSTRSSSPTHTELSPRTPNRLPAALKPFVCISFWFLWIALSQRAAGLQEEPGSDGSAFRPTERQAAPSTNKIQESWSAGFCHFAHPCAEVAAFFLSVGLKAREANSSIYFRKSVGKFQDKTDRLQLLKIQVLYAVSRFKAVKLLIITNSVGSRKNNSKSETCKVTLVPSCGETVYCIIWQLKIW